MEKPVIQPLPTDEQTKKLIDEVVPPELPDRLKKQFARFLLAIANADNREQWMLANVAAHYLYENTFEYEAGFDKFVGFPNEKTYSTAEHYQSVEQEQ